MEPVIDYNTYYFTRSEWVKEVLVGVSFFFVIGMIFYQHIGLSVLATSAVFPYIKERRGLRIKRRRSELLLQFREAMYALSSSLAAGRSVEQAFIQSLKDLRIIYGQDKDIIVEWQLIVHKLQMNATIESALGDFSQRAQIEDIHNFVSVFVIAKKSGGDLVSIIKETTKMINDKIEIQKEIDVLITQKKFEQQILSYIIPGMILFFTLVAPHFLEPLYTSISGRLIMTLALILYVISARIGQKIMAIEV